MIPPPLGLIDLRRLADTGLIVAAGSYGLLLTLFDAMGVLGLALYIGLLLSMWRFSYELLKRVAQGRTTIPPPSAEVLNPFGNYRLVLHLVFFGGLVVLLSDARIWGEGAGATLFRYCGLALIFMAFPASAALMALTGDIGAAMHPRNMTSLMRILGRGYALILAFAAGLLLLSAGLQRIFPGGPLTTLLGACMQAWGLMAVFCLIGAAVHERRDVVDIPGELPSEAERLQQALQKDWQAQMDHAYASIRSGLTDQGYRKIRDLLASSPNTSNDAHEWVFARMLQWEDPTHALEFARRFIDRLIEQEQLYRALMLVSQCRALEKQFRLDRETVDRLAEYARSIGKHALADQMLDAADTPNGQRLTLGEV